MRPYYKPHRVGLHEYCGANAGDFAGINVIDMLLGLCQADNLSYSQLLVDKFLYMLQEDQAILRDVMRHQSFLNGFLEIMDAHGPKKWFQKNAKMFVNVCETHGKTAAQHHNMLVNRFIEKQAELLPENFQENITASGPPLDVVLNALAKLRDLRLAADRDDIPSRYSDINKLKAKLQ